MALKEKVVDMLEKRFGKINTYGRAKAVADEITKVARERLTEMGVPHYCINVSRSTIARMFGLGEERVRMPQVKTLDAIALYLGFDDAKDMAKSMNEIYDVSSFGEADGIDVKSLVKGDVVRIKYDPQREITMSYLGDNRFLVMDPGNSQLCKGDKLTITSLMVGLELMATNVVRGEECLGDYLSAKCGGLTSVELL